MSKGSWPKTGGKISLSQIPGEDGKNPLTVKLVDDESNEDYSALTAGLVGVLMNKPDEKQDCELKAAYRLLGRFKKHFPQLKVILLADGLYPKGPIFRICEDAGWIYLFVLQDKVLSTVWEDFEALAFMPLNALGVKDKDPLKWIENKLYR